VAEENVNTQRRDFMPKMRLSFKEERRSLRNVSKSWRCWRRGKMQKLIELAEIGKTNYPEKNQVTSNHKAENASHFRCNRARYKYLYNQGGGIFMTWVGQAAKRNCDHSKALIVAESLSGVFLIMLRECGGISCALDLLTGERASTRV
jgi:hypothetical protein